MQSSEPDFEGSGDAKGLVDFEDRESFMRWLHGKPPQWAQVLAARAALRVLPLIGYAFHDPKEPFAFEHKPGAILATIRASFVSWAARRYPVHEFRSAAAAAAAAADAATDVGNASTLAARRAHTARDTRTAGAALAAAVFAAVDAARTVVDAAAAAQAISAAVLAARAAAAYGAYSGREVVDDAAAAAAVACWKSIREDAAWLEAREPAGDADADAKALIEQPLWLSNVRGDPKFSVNFPLWAREPFDRMANDPELMKAGFEHWIAWYRGVLPNGRNKTPSSHFGEAADLALATAPDAFWELDPAEVNAEIGRMIRGEQTMYLEKLRAAEGGPEGGEAASISEPSVHLKLMGDAADPSVDYLNRALTAFVLAGRLNRIWDALNSGNDVKGWDRTLRPGFVVHIDAPWGGGKTSFAGFLTRILNPYRHGGELPDWLRTLDLNDDGNWPKEIRRGWHVVEFNAWQHQHVNPPWWVFSEAIRRQCLDAVRHETNRQVKSLPPPEEPYAYEGLAVRLWRSWKCRAGELIWRISVPAVLLPLSTFLLAVALVLVLWNVGWLTRALKVPEDVAPLAASFVTLLLGGGSAVLAVTRLFTQSLVPGTPNAANNYSLGTGDPLDRFRKHFARTMERFGRPIIVVVDDLDRCEPAYVVELIRGMQTIMVSSRVVFVLLGDRDWIEHSFAETHKAMKGIDVGPEHEFGARFVEKAIQFSFVLPEIGEETRLGYVRRLLDLEDAEEQPEEGVGEADEGGEDQDIRSRMEEVLRTDVYEVREAAAEQLRRSDAFSGQLKRELDEKLALRAAADKTAESATSHMIEALTPLLPANPRQIKRIVNAISLMQEVARLHDGIDPGSDRWQVMARWVVLMLEWPKTWHTLSHHPVLADMLVGEGQAVGDTPAGLDKAEEIAAAIGANKAVMELLDFSNPEKGWQPKPITGAEIAWLKRLMPPTSGRPLEPATPAK